MLFQSRNRDTFLFKTATSLKWSTTISTFQSRNRDTFLFKPNPSNQNSALYHSFNLVIEILFFSRQIVHAELVQAVGRGFNLVIEILFFSRCSTSFVKAMVWRFQSRNRDTFLFKPITSTISPSMLWLFQSRNRDTFLFKASRSASPIKQYRHRFNLVIEILFFSSQGEGASATCGHRNVSIS